MEYYIYVSVPPLITALRLQNAFYLYSLRPKLLLIWVIWWIQSLLHIYWTQCKYRAIEAYITKHTYLKMLKTTYNLGQEQAAHIESVCHMLLFKRDIYIHTRPSEKHAETINKKSETRPSCTD
jgi:hypothetical protein